MIIVVGAVEKVGAYDEPFLLLRHVLLQLHYRQAFVLRQHDFLHLLPQLPLLAFAAHRNKSIICQHLLFYIFWRGRWRSPGDGDGEEGRDDRRH